MAFKFNFLSHAAALPIMRNSVRDSNHSHNFRLKHLKQTCSAFAPAPLVTNKKKLKPTFISSLNCRSVLYWLQLFSDIPLLEAGNSNLTQQFICLSTYIILIFLKRQIKPPITIFLCKLLSNFKCFRHRNHIPDDTDDVERSSPTYDISNL